MLSNEDCLKARLSLYTGVYDANTGNVHQTLPSMQPG